MEPSISTAKKPFLGNCQTAAQAVLIAGICFKNGVGDGL
jgi:hypothetical protein